MLWYDKEDKEMCHHFILFIILKTVGLEIRRGEVIAQKNHLA